MPAITGAGAKMGVRVASTWGTAVACGAGHKFIAEVTPSFNVQELVGRSIGSGAIMDNDATIGNYVPTVGLVGDFGYNNNWPVVFAVFFGTAGAPTETTVGQSDYLHTLTVATSLSKYLTLAHEDTTTTTAEYPTALVRSIGLRSASVPGYVEATAELIANKFEKSSATNTNATLANVTLTDTERAKVKFDDDFWIDDASSVALASGDLYSITGFDFALTRPMEVIPEIKGSSGNGVPRIEGLINGTFNITVKELADHTYYAVWEAETVKKALLTVEGTQIGTGTNKHLKLYLPNMKLITEPQAPFTSPGINTLSLNFKLLAANSAPTGMSSVYPYMTITNGLSTSLLA